MHDLNYFRDHLDVLAEMAKSRSTALDLDAFRKLDKERRELITATGMSRSWVYYRLQELASTGRAVQVSRGCWVAASNTDDNGDEVT